MTSVVASVVALRSVGMDRGFDHRRPPAPMTGTTYLRGPGAAAAAQSSRRAARSTPASSRCTLRRERPPAAGAHGQRQRHLRPDPAPGTSTLAELRHDGLVGDGGGDLADLHRADVPRRGAVPQEGMPRRRHVCRVVQHLDAVGREVLRRPALVDALAVEVVRPVRAARGGEHLDEQPSDPLGRQPGGRRTEQVGDQVRPVPVVPAREGPIAASRRVIVLARCGHPAETAPNTPGRRRQSVPRWRRRRRRRPGRRPARDGAARRPRGATGTSPSGRCRRSAGAARCARSR